VLAATGSANGQLVGLAVLLMLAGGGVLMAAKRGTRRQTH
jgi:LPXTG-motif cell wall-anchored protein